MRRYILPIAAAGVLLTAACSSGKPTVDASVPKTPVTAIRSWSGPASSSPSPAKAKPKPKPSPSTTQKDCPTAGDVIVWMRSPGVPDTAQELGGGGGADCESTFKLMQRTAPTGPGNCTQVAWARDNLGYNVDADRAPRLKKVQVSVGPAC